MSWQTFLAAIGLLFVFEGILPFLSPARWRQIMQHMFLQQDHTLRIISLMSMLLGLVLVYLARWI